MSAAIIFSMRQYAAAVLILFIGLALVGCESAESTAKDTPPADVTDSEPAATEDETQALEKWQADYAELLSACVTRRGHVNYQAVRKRVELLGTLVERVAERRPFASDADRFAYLINAYNLLVISQVVSHWPIDSPRDIGGMFNYHKHEVLGESITLDDLRRRMFKVYGDARVHMALVQGALGSPPLRAEPYASETLDAQLTQQARRFVNDGVHVTLLGPTLLVSPIFKWYADDFDAVPYGSVAGFISTYANSDSRLAELLAASPDPAVEYQQFNWALNGGR